MAAVVAVVLLAVLEVLEVLAAAVLAVLMRPVWLVRQTLVAAAVVLVEHQQQVQMAVPV
jgi:hypothetical protein